jgi:two-component sensor histidine kinase
MGGSSRAGGGSSLRAGFSGWLSFTRDILQRRSWVGLEARLNYNDGDNLSIRTGNGSPEAARRRGRWGIFFVGWSVLVAVAVRWLLRRAELTSVSPYWLAGGKASLGDRVGDWLRLVDLNFHQIYPWILLAPYVAWMGTRFLFERGAWRASLAAHLAGGALFAGGCHALAAHADWLRPVLVTVSAEHSERIDGEGVRAGASRRTNVTIVTNISSARWRLPGNGMEDGPGLAEEPGIGPPGVAPPGSAPDDAGDHNWYFIRRRLVGSPMDVLNVLAYASLVGLAHTVHFHRRSKERERRTAVLEAQLTQARLNALQAQLHPHFLFNALNAISTLLLRDARAAQEALTSFSELLRMALSHSTQPEVLLGQDLEFLRRYVEIQQTRLGGRLRFEEVIEAEAMGCLVPALLLQPLVENAIRHGIEPSANPGLVRVIVQRQGERLVVTVEDNGAGLTANEVERGGGKGIGLQNLRSRLETLYGAEHRIALGPGREGGVTVRVEIPLRHAAPAAP